MPPQHVGAAERAKDAELYIQQLYKYYENSRQWRALESRKHALMTIINTRETVNTTKTTIK